MRRGVLGDHMRRLILIAREAGTLVLWSVTLASLLILLDGVFGR